jgi:hypothetical protein
LLDEALPQRQRLADSAYEFADCEIGPVAREMEEHSKSLRDASTRRSACWSTCRTRW